MHNYKHGKILKHVYMNINIYVMHALRKSQTRLTPRTIESIVGELSNNLAPIVDGNAAARAYGIGLYALGDRQAASEFLVDALIKS